MAASQPTQLQQARTKLSRTVDALIKNARDRADAENASPYVDHDKMYTQLSRQYIHDVEELIVEAQAAVVATTPRG